MDFTRKRVRVSTFVIAFRFHSKCVCGRHSSQFFFFVRVSQHVGSYFPNLRRNACSQQWKHEIFFFFQLEYNCYMILH